MLADISKKAGDEAWMGPKWAQVSGGFMFNFFAESYFKMKCEEPPTMVVRQHL